MAVKIESVQFNDDHKTFAASFSDGITVILNTNLQYHNMLSVGPDSYYIRKNKWPAGKNLDNRVQAANVWIMKNKNRYKKWQSPGDHAIIKE